VLKRDYSIKNKLVKVEEKAANIHTIPLPEFSSIPISIKWKNILAENAEYFNPPRFLIVEDVPLGRSNLLRILNKLKLDYLVDIAAYGVEAIKKFKYYLNKG
jgi:hypothetical protein